MEFKDFLVEAAKNIDNYPLSINSNNTLVYLYKNDNELKTALETYNLDKMEDKILFVFGIKEDMGMPTMSAIVAQRGYGPIAYKVAMTLAGSLTPTQDSRLTNSAARVWKEFYNGKGSKDVNSKPFGASEEYYWLRSTYTLKKKLNLSKNIKADKTFIGKDLYGERKTLLDELADGVLSNAMSSIY